MHDALSGENCERYKGDVSRWLLSMFRDHAIKALVPLVVESVEKEREETEPKDMA